MKVNRNIVKKLKQVLAVFLIGGLVSFSDSEQSDRLCTSVSIAIENGDEYKFIDEQFVLDIVTSRGKELLLNQSLSTVNIKALEAKLKEDQFVTEAQVYKGLNGALMIQLKQAEPIARIIKGGKSFYIGKQGNVFAITRRFSARVPLVLVDAKSPLFKHAVLEDKREIELVEFLNYVSQDDFFSRQLTQFKIDKEGEIEIE